MKIVRVAEGAMFVPSYSEQTITRSYDTSTTVQSFGYGCDEDENCEAFVGPQVAAVREPA